MVDRHRPEHDHVVLTDYERREIDWLDRHLASDDHRKGRPASGTRFLLAESLGIVGSSLVGLGVLIPNWLSLILGLLMVLCAVMCCRCPSGRQ